MCHVLGYKETCKNDFCSNNDYGNKKASEQTKITNSEEIGTGVLKSKKEKKLFFSVKEFAQHQSQFFQKDVICHQEDVNP